MIDAIGEARAYIEDAQHWLRTAQTMRIVHLRTGNLDARAEARKRLIAARNRIDAVLAELGGV